MSSVPSDKVLLGSRAARTSGLMPAAATVLARAGSPRCHDCQDRRAPLRPDVVAQARSRGRDEGAHLRPRDPSLALAA